MPQPDPTTLDTINAARQLEALYEMQNTDNLAATYLHGSFANPSKPIDRVGLSDVDVFFVIENDAGDEPTTKPFVRHPTITLSFSDATYDDRAVDALIGTRSAFENRAHKAAIELPVTLPSPSP